MCVQILNIIHIIESLTKGCYWIIRFFLTHFSLNNGIKMYVPEISYVTCLFIDISMQIKLCCLSR